MRRKSWRLGADTTTRSARTARSAIRRLSTYRIAVTYSARHRENRPANLPSGGPKIGSSPNRPETLPSGGPKIGSSPRQPRALFLIGGSLGLRSLATGIVEPAFRQRGYATALVRHVKARAMAASVPTLWLNSPELPRDDLLAPSRHRTWL